MSHVAALAADAMAQFSDNMRMGAADGRHGAAPRRPTALALCGQTSLSRRDRAGLASKERRRPWPLDGDAAECRMSPPCSGAARLVTADGPRPRPPSVPADERPSKMLIVIADMRNMPRLERVRRADATRHLAAARGARPGRLPEIPPSPTQGTNRRVRRATAGRRSASPRSAEWGELSRRSRRTAANVSTSRSRDSQVPLKRAFWPVSISRAISTKIDDDVHQKEAVRSAEASCGGPGDEGRAGGGSRGIVEGRGKCRLERASIIKRT